jgi:uncharacterized protein (TIGR02217 family)
MLQPDTLEIFPTCPTYGFTSEPRYLVKIVAREGGFERRTRKWSRPLHRYVAVPLGDRSAADVQEVLYFWHAVGGMFTTFRFRDWADYKSCAVQDEPSPTDQPFTFIPGSPGGYQLVKRYTAGSLEQLREIVKPEGATIRVANEFGVEQPSNRWILDEATGLLQPIAGFEGTPASWGGQFYVPVRFDSELPVEITNKQIQAATFALAEVRVELPYDQ